MPGVEKGDPPRSRIYPRRDLTMSYFSENESSTNFFLPRRPQMVTVILMFCTSFGRVFGPKFQCTNVQ